MDKKTEKEILKELEEVFIFFTGIVFKDMELEDILKYLGNSTKMQKEFIFNLQINLSTISGLIAIESLKKSN